jgi:hypothetical protein
MNNAPRQQLVKLITKYGNALCEDPVRCEELLKETCGGYPREVSVLVDALKEQVPIELLSSSNNLPRRTLQARLIKNLEETLYLKKEVAKWAVESWAIALGLLETPTVLQFYTPEDRKIDEMPNTPLPPPDVKTEYRRENIIQPEEPILPAEVNPLDNIPAENQITAQDLPLHFQSALSPNPNRLILANRKIGLACMTGFIYGLLMILHMFVHQSNNILLQEHSYNTWYVLTFHDNHWTLLDYVELPLLFFLPLIGWAAGSFSHDIYYLSALDIVLVFGLSFAIYSEKNTLFSVGLFTYFCVSQFLNPMLTNKSLIDRIGWLILFVGVGFLLIQGIQGTFMYRRLSREQGF